MGYVYMAIVLAAWTVIAFVYRWSERRQADRMVMSAAMGLAGTIWAVVYILAFDVDPRAAHPSQWILGIALGIVAAAGIPLFLAAVARGDLSITWTILTLSFGVASVAAMIYPGERPTAVGLTGLALAAVAVTLLGLDMYVRHRSNGPGKPRKGWWLFMSLAFVTNAVSLYAYRLADALPGSPGEVLPPGQAHANTACFLLTMYRVFAVTALVVLLFGGRRGKLGAGMGIGALAGTLLCAGSFFMMFAFSEKIPAFVLFPVANGGSNILVAVLSFLLLKERPKVFGWAGIAVGVVALVCLSLQSPENLRQLLNAVGHLFGKGEMT
jgi:multidrug transporter EmrE-like cation transporter